CAIYRSFGCNRWRGSRRTRSWCWRRFSRKGIWSMFWGTTIGKGFQGELWVPLELEPLLGEFTRGRRCLVEWEGLTVRFESSKL
ncbi:hypothetical protein G4B88_009994, partial [Cannabis sativa]